MYSHKKGDVSNLETGISNLRTPIILKTALNVTERRIIYSIFQDTAHMAK